MECDSAEAIQGIAYIYKTGDNIIIDTAKFWYYFAIHVTLRNSINRDKVRMMTLGWPKIGEYTSRHSHEKVKT
jgi:hypothetical protein